jgi:Fe2+ transport system protein B
MDKDTLIHAAIGAAATVVFSFTVFSPILGGAVAGYLEEHHGGRVGALSGLIASVFVLPFALLFLFLLAGGVFGIAALVLLVIPLVVVLYTVGLSALGGVVGVYIATETDIGGS